MNGFDEMDLEKIKITDIVPAEYNPRQISDSEFLKLQNSISTFGVVDPIIINLKNMHIIGGHQRYDVLLDKYMQEGEFLEELHLLRLGDIGWCFTDTELEVKDDDHEKALNLALNKISGEWDEPKLQDLLEDLSLEGFNLELTGFDNLDLEELNIDTSDVDSDNSDNVRDNEEEEYTTSPDITVEVEYGDVFKLGNHILVCGDAGVKECINKLLNPTGGGGNNY